MDEDSIGIISRLQRLTEEREANGSISRLEESAARLEAENNAAVLRSWGVPILHLDALRERKPTDAIRHVDSWVDSRSTFLTLAGSVGVGKSVGAAYWLSIAARGIQPGIFKNRWYKATDLARVGMYDQKIYEIAECMTLVIDDVGVEYSDVKGAFLTTFGDLIDKRYENKLRTIITTNLSGPSFRERYGERIYDRLCHVGIWASIQGKSMRSGNSQK